LNIMQKLYEQHKALTYPRTDSRYLTSDIVPTLNERLRAIMVGDNAPIASEVIKSRYQIAKSCINNAKVTDHHAIIPTEQKVSLMALSNEEKRIYFLVVKRFLTCFFPTYDYKHIKAEFECEGEKFYATGRVVVNKGWKKVYDIDDEDADENEQTLPSLKYSDTFSCSSVLIKEGKTKPPARYTEATLLTAMENPSKFITDTRMKEYIGGGLGTPATRADVIEKLYSSFYVEKQGKSMVPTSKGMQIVSIVPPDLKEPLLTAKWEEKLDEIAKGKVNKDTFIGDIRQYTKKLVHDVESSDIKYVHDNLTREVCPECGKFLLSVNGKRGKMLVCQDRDCGYRKNVTLKTNVRCPTCHKVMDLYGDGDKKTYICKCGYREKLEAFKKRMNGNGHGANKADVKNYLKNQNKNEDTSNDIFAAAFEKLNL
ncbi:MAG: DNA topoisomerase, partial [Oscillospiraceae bacterium]